MEQMTLNKVVAPEQNIMIIAGHGKAGHISPADLAAGWTVSIMAA